MKEERTAPRRWPRLVIPAVCMLFAGVIYAWSVLKAPLAAEFGWSESALALNFTLTLCFFCVGGVLGSRLTKVTTPRVGLLIAAALVAVGLVASSRMTGNVAVLYVAYAGLTGTGIGIAYNIIISTTNAWFPDKKGICSGVLMMCFGLSSLILGKVADGLFAAPAVGWRGTFLLLGLVIGGVIALCGLGIYLPPAGTVFPAPKKGAKAAGGIVAVELPTHEMVKRPSFWKFFLFAVLTSAAGSSVISFAKDLAMASGAEAALATTLVGALSLCNGLGRIICGFVSDGLGVRKAMVISNAIAILAPLAVLVAVGNSSLGLCVLGLCLTGIAYGFLATIISAFTAAFYGLKYFPSNYSLSNMMLLPASFGATFASLLLTSTGGYTAPILMLVGFAAVAMVINLSIKKP